MTETPYERLKRVFLTALDLPTVDRPAYLQNACSDDPDIRTAIVEMLNSAVDDPQALKPAALDEMISISAPRHVLATRPAVPSYTPDTIGRYPILGKLGEGGMGVVYLARDPKLDRKIAIKTLPPSFATDRARVERFRREARLLASVSHPGISTIYSIEETGGQLFLTMEYVSGKTLAAKLDVAPFPIEDTLRVGREIAGALEAAHARGVIHRDLKPANVMLSDDGVVKVLDFGLARHLAAADPLTQPGWPLGTPGYMSPEQLRGDELDGRADVFGLGCLVYACLAGDSPFRRTTFEATLLATLESEPDLDALPAAAAGPLRDLIGDCLSKSPSDRIGSMSDVRHALDEFIVSGVEYVRTPVPTARTPHNLPRRFNTFVGRRQELAQVPPLLRSKRLVTLTGIGGGGKSRLAVELASSQLPDYPDGVWRMGFVTATDRESLLHTVASVLHLSERPEQSLLDTIRSHLASSDTLLIFDNCEHVSTAIGELATTLLVNCPEVRILATSRKPLEIEGETIFRLPPLLVPDPARDVEPADLAHVESVKLFVDRATSASQYFVLDATTGPAVARICQRLDGVPLAIELAAARVGVLTVADIAERLADRFRLLTATREQDSPHHRALRALIDWSHDLLSPEQATVFRRLAAFAGTWSLPSAEQVCAGEDIDEWQVLDLHSHLVDCSLVEMDSRGRGPDTRARYRMLESIRVYAQERLVESGEERDVLRRHRHHFADLIEHDDTGAAESEPGARFDRLAIHHDDILAAIQSFLDSGEARLAASAVTRLHRFWIVRGYWTLGLEVCGRVLDRLDEMSEEYVELLIAAGGLAWSRGATDRAGELYREGGERAKRLGNRVRQAEALRGLGTTRYREGDRATAQTLLTESVSILRELGEEAPLAVSLSSLAGVQYTLGDSVAAEKNARESLAIWRRVGDEPQRLRTLNNLAVMVLRRADYDESRTILEECLALARRLGDLHMTASTLSNLGLLDHRLGQDGITPARGHFEESLQIRRQLEDPAGVALALRNLGVVIEEEGDVARARALQEESVTLAREIGDDEGVAYSLANLAAMAERSGNLELALSHQRERLQLFRKLGSATGVVETLEGFANVFQLRGEPEKTVRLLGAAAAERARIGTPTPESDRERLDRMIVEVRAVLGEDGYADGYREGEGIPLEKVVSSLLEDK